jgi:hypothetical protein
LALLLRMAALLSLHLSAARPPRANPFIQCC